MKNSPRAGQQILEQVRSQLSVPEHDIDLRRYPGGREQFIADLQWALGSGRLTEKETNTARSIQDQLSHSRGLRPNIRPSPTRH